MTFQDVLDAMRASAAESNVAANLHDNQPVAFGDRGGSADQREARIVEALSIRPMTAKDITAYFASTAHINTIRLDLRRMEHTGVVQRQDGPGRTVVWELADVA